MEHLVIISTCSIFVLYLISINLENLHLLFCLPYPRICFLHHFHGCLIDRPVNISVAFNLHCLSFGTISYVV